MCNIYSEYLPTWKIEDIRGKIGCAKEVQLMSIKEHFYICIPKRYNQLT
jgi:hypothetical protein